MRNKLFYVVAFFLYACLGVRLYAFDFTYIISNGSIKITKYNGKGGVVVVPSAIEEKEVTAIGYEAFGECESITKIILPDTITTIEKGAFTWCVNLVEINLPDSIITIGGGAFSDCWKLSEIRLPKYLKIICNL